MNKQAPSPHFFRRDDHGRVSIRLRFTAEEAANIEEAAGERPLLPYLYEIINERAEREAYEARRKLTERVPVPKEDIA